MIASFPVETPVGVVTLLYQEEPFQLVHIALPGEKLSLNGVGASRRSPSERIRKASSLIVSYFKGRRITTPWRILQMDRMTRFQRAVLEETAKIPYGGLKTYGELAQTLGRPAACRAVGNALARNPFPILIPCHRVIRSDHTLGGFGGGAVLKAWLISHESGASLAHQSPAVIYFF